MGQIIFWSLSPYLRSKNADKKYHKYGTGLKRKRSAYDAIPKQDLVIDEAVVEMVQNSISKF